MRNKIGCAVALLMSCYSVGALAATKELTVDEGIAARGEAELLMMFDMCHETAIVAKQEAAFKGFMDGHTQGGRPALGDVQAGAVLDAGEMMQKAGGPNVVCPGMKSDPGKVLPLIQSKWADLLKAHAAAHH